MQIALDTNVFISVVVFGSKPLGEMLAGICERHTLVLSSYVVEELSRVVRAKFPGKASAMDDILFYLPYETEFTPHTLPEHGWFTIRDADDEKVLYSAMTADVDVLITGDKDLTSLKLERPEILTPSAFLAKYPLA